jgi:hypothetical protein
MTDTYKIIENRLQMALGYYHENPDQTFAKFAREFNVPYDRLRKRAAGQKSRSERVPTNLKLNIAQ